MPINSRQKGKSGELQLIKELKGWLGDDLDIQRNLQQTRQGGYDITGVSGWAIECKRPAKFKLGDLNGWWKQTVRQANDAELKPVLFVRANNQPWFAYIKLSSDGLFNDDDPRSMMQIHLEAWCAIVRESLPLSYKT